MVAFYLLRDWDKLIARVDSWLPRHYDRPSGCWGRPMARCPASCAVSSGACARLLSMPSAGVLGLNYSLILGLIAGILSSFAGPFFGAGLAVLSSHQSVRRRLHAIGLVYGVFIVVRVIEGSVLTPT